MCSVFVSSLFVAALIVCWGLLLDACFVLLFVVSSFAIISLGKRELGALVRSEICVASVLWIFLVVPWVGLSYVAVVFYGHTHLPFSFPVASQAKYFCKLDIRSNDEQEHRSI